MEGILDRSHRDVIAVGADINVPRRGHFDMSIDWFKGEITGKSHILWENLWFPVDFPLSQPIDP